MSRKFTLNILERKFILLLGDIMVILLSLFYFLNYSFPFIKVSYFFAAVFYILGLSLYLSLAYILNSYNFENQPTLSIKMVSRTSAITFLFVLIEIVVCMLYFKTSVSRKHILLFYFFTPVFVLGWRYLFDNVFKFLPPVRSVFYLYDKYSVDSLSDDQESINGKDKNTFYNVTKKHYVDGEIAGNESTPKLDKIDCWVINVKNYSKLPEHLKKNILNAILEGKEVITFTSFYENNYEALPIKWHNDSFYEILQLQNRKIRYLHSLSSFMINLLLSLFVGLIFLMVFPFVYLLNFFFNRGPIFYTQKRVGQYGKEFNIYKFRSMVIEAESAGAKMAVKNDARVTPFGKILRKFRIDELPQIIAVMKGDMKFIGPRPERLIFTDQLNEITPFYKVRHFIKPGITGWAQVMYKYGENLEDSIQKLEYDLFYIKNKSITLDLRIVFKTVTTVLFSRGL